MHDLMSAQIHLQQLAWNQGAVANAGRADVGIAVVDQRTGPVVPAFGIIPNEHFPKNSTAGRVQGIPVGIATPDIDHSILHICPR
jgi:hypothetical protein